MNKIKLALTVIVMGFLGLQYSFIAQAQNISKNLICNNTKKQK